MYTITWTAAWEARIPDVERLQYVAPESVIEEPYNPHR